MNRMIRCQCAVCADRDKCKYAVKFQRMPREDGGLGLCPRLASNTDPVFNEDKGQYERKSVR